MLFQITKNKNEWSICPLTGAFEGHVVATAEAINMRSVKTVARSFVGTITAVWGVTIIDEAVYSDIETFRSLCLGRAFDSREGEKLRIDYDGVYGLGNTVVHAMDRLVTLGEKIYGRNSR